MITWGVHCQGLSLSLSLSLYIYIYFFVCVCVAKMLKKDLKLKKKHFGKAMKMAKVYV